VPSNDVLVDGADGIASVTLNRPDKLNALSVVMQQQLADLLWAADRNPDVRVVLLRRTLAAEVEDLPGDVTGFP
jgi:enoyl-CoA hydratase/carnithine racemase